MLVTGSNVAKKTKLLGNVLNRNSFRETWGDSILFMYMLCIIYIKTSMKLEVIVYIHGYSTRVEFRGHILRNARELCILMIISKW